MNSIIQNIQSNLKIIAFDGNNNSPSSFYLSKKSDDFEELTKALLVVIDENMVYSPQYLGSYSARCCPVININNLNCSEDQVWTRILNMEERALLMLNWYCSNDWDILKTMEDFNGLYIRDYMSYIREIPYLHQSFDIKRSHWEELLSPELLNQIFQSSDPNAGITISRNDLFIDQSPLEVFIIKVLMWGYPTTGRGNNIRNFLADTNQLNSFVQKFNEIIQLTGINENILAGLLLNKGAKLSTVSKFLYFKKIKINGYPSMILDLKVITALSSGRFRDPILQQFKNIKYENALKYFPLYNQVLFQLAEKYNVKPDQIELFLFNHGLNLKA